MALKATTKNQLRVAFANSAVAEQLTDAIEAGGGVVSEDARSQIAGSLGIPRAQRVCDAIEAGQKIDRADLPAFINALSSHPAAMDIQDHLASA